MNEISCSKVSIIIVSYNTFNYVSRCVDSALSQGLDDYEIVIVDDFSSDGTYELLTERYGNNPAIKLYQNGQNMGAGYSKNFALNKSCGDYICFVDSDDWLHKNSLIRIYRLAIENDVDDIFYGFDFYNECDIVPEVKTSEKLEIKRIFENGSKCLEWMLDNNSLTVSACHHFVKRSQITPQIRFTEKAINDDWEFSVLLMLSIGKIAILNSNIYTYFRRKNGSITLKSKEVSLILDTYKHLDNAVNKLQWPQMQNRLKIFEKAVNREMVFIRCERLSEKKNCIEEYEKFIELIENNSYLKELFNQSYGKSKYGYFNHRDFAFLRERQDKSILLYGAGDYGADAFRVFSELLIDVEGFCVTRKDVSTLFGKKIYEINEIRNISKYIFVICVSKKYMDEIIKTLDERCAEYYLYVPQRINPNPECEDENNSEPANYVQLFI